MKLMANVSTGERLVNYMMSIPNGLGPNKGDFSYTRVSGQTKLSIFHHFPLVLELEVAPRIYDFSNDPGTLGIG